MTPDELIDYILTLIETYDPLYEYTDTDEEWIDADPMEKEISLTLRTLWGEIQLDVDQLSGKNTVRH
jgi:hypothetical protein